MIRHLKKEKIHIFESIIGKHKLHHRMVALTVNNTATRWL